MDAAPNTTAEATEPRIYRIPSINLASFRQAMDRLAKRADKLGVPAPTTAVVGVEDVDYPASEAGGWYVPAHTITYTLVTVEGEAPSFAGWKLTAVIDRDLEEPGAPNVVHSSGSVESEWRTIGDRCDHCYPRRARGRKTLVVVTHEDGRRKVVGTRCLRDFLGHTAPQAIASWAEVICSLDDLAGSYEDAPERFRGEERWVPVDFLAWVICCIRNEGWVSKSQAWETGREATANVAVFLMELARKDRLDRGHPAPTGADKAAAVAALEWALELPIDNDNDYLANVRAVAGKQGWRAKDLGIGASIAAAHAREVERRVRDEAKAEAAASSFHVGTVGERSTWTATVTSVRTVASDFGMMAFVEFLTPEGALLEWKASRASAAPEVGQQVEVKGTVKAHGTVYRGDAPLTILSRCAVKVLQAVTA